MATIYNRIAGQGLDRLAALSDGVFAFAMTLLVIDIRVPETGSVHSEAELWAALLALAPRFVMYLMSFLTLGIFWVGQQTQLNQFARTDRDLSWLHILFLAAVAMLPFTTSLLAEFIDFRVALLIYWANILVLGIVLLAGWQYAWRHALIKEGTGPEIAAAFRRRVVVAQLLYAIGAALCAIDTYWSIGFIFAVQLFYAVGPRRGWLAKL